AVDDRFVYVSDTGNNRVQIFTKKGQFVLAFGKKGSGKGEFNGPVGICLGKKGQIYIADMANHRVQVLQIRM
ncbi:MAG: 6-bladed beta-propeller, partial [Candidatus Margulisbacteria bacterium]|nr:6-bladed beta-propeller [Candidatus Margulisiibacteriota bacterium]